MKDGSLVSPFHLPHRFMTFLCQMKSQVLCKLDHFVIANISFHCLAYTNVSNFFAEIFVHNLLFNYDSNMTGNKRHLPDCKIYKRLLKIIKKATFTKTFLQSSTEAVFLVMCDLSMNEL